MSLRPASTARPALPQSRPSGRKAQARFHLRAVFDATDAVARRKNPAVSGSRLLSTVAAYADAASNLKRFENAAGRAAMIGTFVALATETFTKHGLFNQLGSRDLVEYTSLVFIGVASASVVAVQSRSPLGRELTNALILSLKSSISSQGEKSIVDDVLNEVISAELLEILARDDDTTSQL
eukprot:CAMPEP_0117672796 /NCGR_PEP_ID=MMETSP0804-20121206/14108_1 /TAXON_ID=1074897 /ORGANISM="Tetraselmis astigmatica, Strain CCMP880" /LENGTH=180 /DNA_ID=CAMNT_0005481447 /DNA_START=261 /DNA_END=803 /DNA_ORIENTATION=+